jgi:hypothetical protein
MTKRADRRLDGYLPEYERPEGERYARRGPDQKWTEAQDAVLVAAVCACRGRPAYLGMAPHLMLALGHPPTYADVCVPHPTKHTRTCVRALELRLVSKMLAAYNDWRPGGFAGFHRHTHEESPLTWGMKVKILRPYYARQLKNQPRLTFEDLLRMIGRTTGKAVLDYFNRLDGPDFTDEGDDTAEPPVKACAVERLADYVTSLDCCKEVNEPSWKYKDAVNRLLRA